MGESMFAGATDYSHQPLSEIRRDIESWISYIEDGRREVSRHWEQIKSSGQEGEIRFNLAATIEGSLLFFESAIEDLTDVVNGIDGTIENRHVRLLGNVGRVAWDLDGRWGSSWNESPRTRFGTPIFSILEKIYKEGRQTCVDLMNAGNAAARLEDFVGRSLTKTDKGLLEQAAEALELKPGAFGLSIDIKRVVSTGWRWLRRSRWWRRD